MASCLIWAGSERALLSAHLFRTQESKDGARSPTASCCEEEAGLDLFLSRSAEPSNVTPIDT
jgi:hypothetical protein